MPRTDASLLAAVRAIFAAHGPLTAEQYDKLTTDLYKPGRPILRRSFGKWKTMCRRIENGEPELRPESDAAHVPPVFTDKKRGELDWREVIDAAVVQQGILRRNSWSQDACKITIPTNDPIAIAYTSDEHLGSLATDYRAWRADLDYLLETPGLYAISCGDMIDNYRQFRSVAPVISQIIPPDLQEDILAQIIGELVGANKLLAAGAGNHDTEFAERIYGKANAEKIISRLVPFFNGKGAAEITVGNQRYSSLIIHKTRFNSFLNDLHGAKREYQLTLPADVVATAHTHKPAFEMYYHYDMAHELGWGIGPYSFLIKSGTYKVECPYSKRYWTKGIIGTPTVVYYPDMRNMLVFRTAREAMVYVNAVKGVKEAS
jgi:hypothetical protein